ncbi:hypothetical protein [Levilactobacillus spicheri]|uniref:Uncharacterized protein n=1 Tax=Levilactobacillus spicheri TaxID=216463 RepID=A0A0F3RUL4_9LACO|nr:hypothetical protein [Levilactobacillus spicheri]KJW13691.1 hypothetical protein VC81_01555 [Levilactobacillus spicheri]
MHNWLELNGWLRMGVVYGVGLVLTGIEVGVALYCERRHPLSRAVVWGMLLTTCLAITVATLAQPFLP